MAASAFLQSSLGICAHVQALHDKGDVRQMHYRFSTKFLPRLDTGNSSKNNCGTLSTQVRTKFWPPSYVKVSQATLAVASDSVASESDSQEELDNRNQNSALFPDGCESFIMEICDETSVAEVKLKAGNFEMHMRRNIDKSKVPSSDAPPLTPPPIPSKPMVDSDPIVSTPASSSNPPKPSPTGSDLLINRISLSEVPKVKSQILEESGDDGFCFVTSPKVGIFRRSRIAKGKVGPVLCKEGQTIKEGQVVCYIEQFSASSPVASTMSGEVVRVLWNDGEPVGYGDPLFAVLPSFHGIK
uniref:Lipoyl-binding domain-containing protein n=1 Tax=Araucaria cunninghamii TaxID=56994 RepID=A0A0D6QYG3_ARACU